MKKRSSEVDIAVGDKVLVGVRVKQGSFGKVWRVREHKDGFHIRDSFRNGFNKWYEG